MIVEFTECLFSKLKIIKNYLRNSNNEDRLSNIAILDIKKQRTQELDINKLINGIVNNTVAKGKKF